jgi:GDPmannose 4,6-dehydratase
MNFSLSAEILWSIHGGAAPLWCEVFPDRAFDTTQLSFFKQRESRVEESSVAKRTALITGVTGQDGAYLSAFLLEKGYRVFGTFRRTSSRNFERLEYLGILNDVELIPLDLLDQSSLFFALRTTAPDEIYNLAAQSFVGASFEQPVATGEITALGAVRLLDAVLTSGLRPKFYQASSSEMFGDVGNGVRQSEETPYRPCSPYATAKLYAHWATVNYRDAYGLFACSGILFNHESPLRGIEFVTRKIADGVARIKLGLQEKIVLGNIHAKRDWGYAPDYVEAMWRILQRETPSDYVIASGKSYSVAEFVSMACRQAGLREGAQDYIEINPDLMRPSEVGYLQGDPSKAIRELGWNPSKTPIEELVRTMVVADIQRVEREIQNGRHQHKVATANFVTPHRE